MSYYKQRLTHDSDSIRKSVYQLGRKVESSLQNAVEALLTRNDNLAYSTVIGDHPINRASEGLNEQCHYFIAKHLPSAGYLRFISSSMRMILLLERMGDYAATISRESVKLKMPLKGTFRAEVEAMAADAFQMFDRALTAYSDQNEELALETMRFAEQVNRDYRKALDDLLGADHLDVADVIARLIVISQLERVSDQAKNICEETVFAVSGETKKRRPMRIVFVETEKPSLSVIAASIGNKFFSDRGEFAAASNFLDAEPDDQVRSFLEQKNLGDEVHVGYCLRWTKDDWRKYDVVICLNCTYDDVVEEMPFLSAAFNWWIPAEDADQEEFISEYSFLHTHIEELVVTLRGETQKELTG